MRRFVVCLPLVLALFLVLAPIAMGAGPEASGEGTYGETNDKVVTNAGFIVIAFFPLFVALMSTLQWLLDRRKARRKKHLPAADWSGGW
jgi:hypothetical protein